MQPLNAFRLARRHHDGLRARLWGQSVAARQKLQCKGASLRRSSEYKSIPVLVQLGGLLAEFFSQLCRLKV